MRHRLIKLNFNTNTYIQFIIFINIIMFYMFFIYNTFPILLFI